MLFQGIVKEASQEVRKETLAITRLGTSADKEVTAICNAIAVIINTIFVIPIQTKIQIQTQIQIQIQTERQDLSSVHTGHYSSSKVQYTKVLNTRVTVTTV